MEPTSMSPNSVSGDTGGTTEHARRSLESAKATADELAARGTEAIRSGANRAREKISQTTDQAAQYVQEQPLKSLLMAVAAGAVIALLAGALGKHRHER